MIISAAHYMMLADTSAANVAMRSFLAPVMTTLVALASLAVVFFLVTGGLAYISSSGNPEKLDHAKRIIRNALIGLVMVIGAGTLVAILSHAYTGAGTSLGERLPALTTIKPQQTNNGLVSSIINMIIGLLTSLVQSISEPFLDALKFFTTSTPLMADNSSVFNLWLAIVGIADALFVLVVALLGFHVMSFATFGLEEIEIKHLLPRIGLAFLLVNSSIFIIDAVVSLSNGMIGALNAAFPAQTVWSSLKSIASQPETLGLAGLMIMVAFLILTVMLMIYYVLRLVTLYIGAVLSPIVLLVWLLPDFKHFAEAAARAYVAVIFVLFIHVVILELAASIFGGMVLATPDHALNPLMSLVVGIATVLALLKTQNVLTQLTMASLGPKTATQLGGLVSNLAGHYMNKAGRRGVSSADRSTKPDDYVPPRPDSNTGEPKDYSKTTRPAPQGFATQSQYRQPEVGQLPPPVEDEQSVNRKREVKGATA